MLASGWVEQRLEWLRSVADATNTPHILAGTYDLLHLWNLNGQMGRPSHDIHFGRYHLERLDDQEQFLRVLVSSEQQLPEGVRRTCRARAERRSHGVAALLSVPSPAAANSPIRC